MPKPDPSIEIFHGRQWPVGLGNASKRIGISPGHLHQVLTGKRKSRRTQQAYETLVAELKGADAAR